MIAVDLSKCTGCRRCEASCAFFHTGRVSNRLARIRVLNIYEIGVDAPIVCGQCKERYCVESCPDTALTVGPLGQVYHSATRCNLCGVCEKSCPIGAIEVFNDYVYVCDLCGGDPKCVPACSEEAITWQREDQPAISLEVFKKSSRKLNPSERRLAHAMRQAAALRKEWFGA
ncbi:MAG: 4Fe-4S dicluster domain-containing protein [bacterium]|nr:4Fe-4S dicluster domain-containing protein [bacterium]